MDNEIREKNNKDNSKHAILIGAGELDVSMAAVIKNSMSESDFVIALDGGLMFCAEHDIEPDMIVGDFDSLSTMQYRKESSKEELHVQYIEGTDIISEPELLKKYPKDIVYRLPCEKDDTDTLAAIKIAINKGFEQFTIYGGLGGRLSHTVANIQSLYYLKERGMHGELVGDNSRIFLIQNECIKLLPYKREAVKKELQPYITEGKMKQDLVKEETLGLVQQNYGYISIFAYSQKAQGVTLKNLKYEIEDAELTNLFPIGISNEFVGKEVEISVKTGVLLVVMES